METPDPNSPNLTHRTVFSDPADGRFRNRIIAQFDQMLKASDLPEEDRKAIIELLVVIALKFAALWAHDHRYEKLETELIEEAGKNPIDHRQEGPVHFATAQGLYIEFDGFLVQVKSVLDHMINVLHYTHGLNFGSLSTFGDSGKSVVNILKRNVSDKHHAGRKETAAHLIRVIENNRDWLAATIEIRDRMNHYMRGGLSPEGFAVMTVIDLDGTERLLRPRISPDKTIKQLMTGLMAIVLEFVEHFVGTALATNLVEKGLHWEDTDDPVRARWELLPGSVIEERMARDAAQSQSSAP